MDWTAIWLSVRLAAATTLVLLAIGVPLAYWIVFSPRRWKFLVEAVVALPLVLPPTVLGFYVLVAIGPLSPVGRAYARLAGHGLPFTFEGLLIASVLYSLPFAVQPFAAEFASVDRRLLEASWSLGVSRLETFRRVVIPLSVRGLVTGIVLSFAHTLGEFGVVLMVGGNLPGVTRTVSISIYDAVQSLDYAAASRTSLLLLIVSFADPRVHVFAAAVGMAEAASLTAGRRGACTSRSRSGSPAGSRSTRARRRAPARVDAGAVRTVGRRQDDDPAPDRRVSSVPTPGVIRFGGDVWCDTARGVWQSAAIPPRRPRVSGADPVPAPHRPRQYCLRRQTLDL